MLDSACPRTGVRPQEPHDHHHQPPSGRSSPSSRPHRTSRPGRDRPGLPPLATAHHPLRRRRGHHRRHQEQLTYQGFLAELLLTEVDDRDRRSTLRRIKSAGFPRDKWLADFDFTANPNINPATINELATGDWIRRGDPLCLIGDSGTGKSHLLIALGTAAAEQGYRVRYTLATRLVNELVEAADEKQLTKTINRYGRVDLLVIDELGYMELDRRGAELLFQVLTEREEKNAIAIASNQSFSAWTDTFTDPRLCAAIVDRLTYNATIIETGTNSYRLAHTRARHL